MWVFIIRQQLKPPSGIRAPGVKIIRLKAVGPGVLYLHGAVSARPRGWCYGLTCVLASPGNRASTQLADAGDYAPWYVRTPKWRRHCKVKLVDSDPNFVKSQKLGLNVAHPNKKTGFWGANCFRDNLEKVFSPSNWVRGVSQYGPIGFGSINPSFGYFW